MMFPGFARCSQGKRDRQALVDLSKETVHTNPGNCSTIGKKPKTKLVENSVDISNF
jgi:hypothetical protein